MSTTNIPRVFSDEELEQKKLFYEQMSPRRRKFIDRIGFDVWDPFEAPKEPMDMRVDRTNRTIHQLVEEFLRDMHVVSKHSEYARGAFECAKGLVTSEAKEQGIFDFCLWYNELLKKEKP